MWKIQLARYLCIVTFVSCFTGMIAFVADIEWLLKGCLMLMGLVAVLYLPVLILYLGVEKKIPGINFLLLLLGIFWLIITVFSIFFFDSSILHSI